LNLKLLWFDRDERNGYRVTAKIEVLVPASVIKSAKKTCLKNLLASGI